MEFGPIPLESFGTFTMCILIAYLAGSLSGYFIRSLNKQEKNQ